MTNLILYSIILSKSKYEKKEDTLKEIYKMFPCEHNIKFVRETENVWKFRFKPKHHFDNKSFVKKIINSDISLILGFLNE
jgi:hypothetical protein